MRRSVSYSLLVLFFGCALLLGRNDDSNSYIYTLSDEYRAGRKVTLAGVIGNTEFSAYAKFIHGEIFSPGIREAKDLGRIYKGKTILARSYGEVPVVSIYVGSGSLPYPILRKSCMDQYTLRYLVGENVILEGQLVERLQFPGVSDKKYKAIFGKKLTVVGGPNDGKQIVCQFRSHENWSVTTYPKGKLVFPHHDYTDEEVREGRVPNRHISSLEDSQLEFVPKHQFRYVRHYKNWVFPPEYWSEGNDNFAMLTSEEFDKLTGKEHEVIDAKTARKELFAFNEAEPLYDALRKKLAARKRAKQTQPKRDRVWGDYWDKYYTTPDEPGKKFKYTGKFPAHHRTAFMIFNRFVSKERKRGPGLFEYYYEIKHEPSVHRVK